MSRGPLPQQWGPRDSTEGGLWKTGGQRADSHHHVSVIELSCCLGCSHFPLCFLSDWTVLICRELLALALSLVSNKQDYHRCCEQRFKLSFYFGRFALVLGIHPLKFNFYWHLCSQLNSTQCPGQRLFKEGNLDLCCPWL